jgi:hypothetical protein
MRLEKPLAQAAHHLGHLANPTIEAHDAKIETVLSGNSREFCGRPDQHPYELFRQLEEIDHRITRVKRPQSNGIVERFQRTLDLVGDGRRSRRLSWWQQSARAARHEWAHIGTGLQRRLAAVAAPERRKSVNP